MRSEIEFRRHTKSSESPSLFQTPSSLPLTIRINFNGGLSGLLVRVQQKSEKVLTEGSMDGSISTMRITGAQSRLFYR